MRKTYLFPAKRGMSGIRYTRFAKDDSMGGATGGAGDAGANNSAGNAGDSNGSAAGQDNNGQSFDAAAFWNDPSGDGTGSATPGQQPQPNQGKQPQGQQPDPGSNVGATIKGMIDGFAPKAIFDADIASQISEGNLEGINGNMQAFGQAVMTQSIGMVAHILKAYEQQMDGRFKSFVADQINSNQSNNNDAQLLERSFPSYKNPATRPVVESVFAQSLRHSGGDRNKAVDMTRSMLQAMGQSGVEDFGFDRAAVSPEGFLGDGPSSLVADLLASG